MKIKIPVLITIVIIVSSFVSFAQTAKKSNAVQAASNSSQAIRSTPAYAEVLLRKTDLEADLEDMIVSYTEENPKVKNTRYELGLINAALDKILAVDAAQASKLTLALGKLIVRKAQLETDLWSLQTKYGKDHVEVKRATRKVDVFEKAVKEILP